MKFCTVCQMALLDASFIDVFLLHCGTLPSIVCVQILLLYKVLYKSCEDFRQRVSHCDIVERKEKMVIKITGTKL